MPPFDLDARAAAYELAVHWAKKNTGQVQIIVQTAQDAMNLRSVLAVLVPFESLVCANDRVLQIKGCAPILIYRYDSPALKALATALTYYKIVVGLDYPTLHSQWPVFKDWSDTMGTEQHPYGMAVILDNKTPVPLSCAFNVITTSAERLLRISLDIRNEEAGEDEDSFEDMIQLLESLVYDYEKDFWIVEETLDKPILTVCMCFRRVFRFGDADAHGLRPLGRSIAKVVGQRLDDLRIDEFHMTSDELVLLDFDTMGAQLDDLFHQFQWHLEPAGVVRDDKELPSDTVVKSGRKRLMRGK